MTRSLLVVLASVWLSLPLHDCFAQPLHVDSAMIASVHCDHHLPGELARESDGDPHHLRCADLVTASIDARSLLLPLDPAPAFASLLERIQAVNQLSCEWRRSPPTARPPPRSNRPLHLLKASLLI